MQAYDIIPYGDSDGISLDRNHHLVNVTEMFKASSAPEHKRPAKWMATEPAQELLTILSEDSYGSIIDTREGKHGGTWYCEELALAYAMHLSPRLHLACLRFILNSQRPPQPSAPAAQFAALEQRVAALEQARQPAQETLTITVSLDPSERINVMRDLGGIVTPSQLFAELRRRGQAATSTGIRQWLHRAARRGELRRRHRGQYEVSDTDTPPANKEH
jgi:hypothetical protein